MQGSKVSIVLSDPENRDFSENRPDLSRISGCISVIGHQGLRLKDNIELDI